MISSFKTDFGRPLLPSIFLIEDSQCKLRLGLKEYSSKPANVLYTFIYTYILLIATYIATFDSNSKLNFSLTVHHKKKIQYLEILIFFPTAIYFVSYLIKTLSMVI